MSQPARHVHAGEGDLGRADEVEVVFGDGVDLVTVGREEPGVDHHLFANQQKLGSMDLWQHILNCL